MGNTTTTRASNSSSSAAEAATDQSLAQRPGGRRQRRAEQYRGRERFHDRQDADEETADKEHENAALDQCHPRGIVPHPLVGKLTEFISHGPAR
jgi:hypothetical protein